ncbi:hypothetical protein CEXT_366951 [Caerostris extrusa]|uniref:Uncharacterized protein n=1 Tax=Caerostris extrusa TaxID=172846 RepID=A0AAV4RF76_CAEEX|nr:hypothetical protein CEXT_366951 [Caerostris extrusa]
MLHNIDNTFPLLTHPSWMGKAKFNTLPEHKMLAARQSPMKAPQSTPSESSFCFPAPAYILLHRFQMTAHSALYHRKESLPISGQKWNTGSEMSNLAFRKLLLDLR